MVLIGSVGNAQGLMVKCLQKIGSCRIVLNCCYWQWPHLEMECIATVYCTWKNIPTHFSVIYIYSLKSCHTVGPKGIKGFLHISVCKNLHPPPLSRCSIDSHCKEMAQQAKQQQLAQTFYLSFDNYSATATRVHCSRACKVYNSHIFSQREFRILGVFTRTSVRWECLGGCN